MNRSIVFVAAGLAVLASGPWIMGQTGGTVTSHNGTTDSVPPGTGQVAVSFYFPSGASLAGESEQFYALVTHEAAFAYDSPTDPTVSIDLEIYNQTGVSWSGFRIRLDGADFYGHGTPLTQAPATDPVVDARTSPPAPEDIRFYRIGPNVSDVTLLGSSLARLNDQGSGFVDSELTVLFDDPFESGAVLEHVHLGFHVRPSPGAPNVAGFTAAFTPIPEPASLALVAVGILATVSRRKPA